MSLSRADIHKGAVALEQIAICFHDLASASDAVVNAQRKLSKALKDSVSTKGCPSLAKDALNASAWILDALIESDAVYARTIEREYEVLSASLRRWFKKLAKDEREHDNFIAIREARIRHAGEAYERRAMKKDIAQEYGHYAETLNLCGAEISAAQQQHVNNSNARHATTMISSGACLTRLADAAWLRTCESLRRCAQGVGNVGSARAWCESGADQSFPDRANSEPPALEKPETAHRPLPDPSFRPPSYNAGSVLEGTRNPTASDLQGPRHSSDAEDSNGNTSELNQHLPAQASRPAYPSAESDLSLEYYSSAPVDAVSGTNLSSTDSSSVVTPQDEGIAHPQLRRGFDSPVDTQLPSNPTPRSQSSMHNFQRPVSRAGRVDHIAESHIHTPTVPTQRVPSPRASLPTPVIPSSLGIPRSLPSQAFSHETSVPNPYNTTYEDFGVPRPTVQTRSVTPNLPRGKSPTWVGKGLRRLSMPTFTNNR